MCSMPCEAALPHHPWLPHSRGEYMCAVKVHVLSERGELSTVYNASDVVPFVSLVYIHRGLRELVRIGQVMLW